MKKKSLNLKESTEGYMRKFGGKKMKTQITEVYYNLKK